MKKKCCECRKYKAPEEFHRRAAAKDGRNAMCKACDHERAMRRRGDPGRPWTPPWSQMTALELVTDWLAAKVFGSDVRPQDWVSAAWCTVRVVVHTDWKGVK